jgi:hypothetical protein
MALAVQAGPRPRVFVGTTEYAGPSLLVDGQTYVDAARFARAMGWAVHQTDAGLQIAASKAQLGGSGPLTVNGQSFTGATQVDHGQWYASLADLSSMLHGSVKILPQYNAIKANIPGMPAPALGPKVAEHPVDSSARYRLIEFYADGSGECRKLQPELAQFVLQHKGVTLVEVNTDDPGPNEEYVQYAPKGEGIPLIVLLDSEGKVLTAWVGFVDQPTLDEQLGKFIKQ